MINENQFQYFCENMRHLRKVRDLTQKEMAQLLHISVGYVRRIEKGELPPKLSCEILFDINKVFGIPISLLFTPVFKDDL